MKIIVDKMPTTPKDCPYGLKHYNYDDDSCITVCNWNDNGRMCFNTEDCPFFAVKEDDDNAQ